MVSTGPVSDPENRRERARIARAAQTGVAYHARKLAELLPPLSADEVEAIGRLAAALDARRDHRVVS
jgi:hypothetical protein